MAVEDFTTYTEVDTTSKLTVASGSVTAASVPRNVDAYVYKDAGAGNLTDLAIDFQINVSSSADYSLGVVCGVANQVDDFYAWTAGIACYLYKGAGVNLILGIWCKETATSEAVMEVTTSTDYYCTWKRTAATGVNWVYVYSDSSRSTLIGVRRYVGSTTAFRYKYAYASYNSGDASLIHSVVTSNHDYSSTANDYTETKTTIKTGVNGTIYDGRIDSGAGTYSYGSHSAEYIGVNTNTRKSLQRYNTSGVISSGLLCSRVDLYMYDADWSSRTTNGSVTLYKIASGNSGWIETPVTDTTYTGGPCWNKKLYNTTNWAGSVGLGTSGTDYDARSMGSANTTDGTAQWIQIKWTGFGCLVMDGWLGGTGGDGVVAVGAAAGNSGTYFYSSQNGEEWRPYLDVYTVDPAESFGGGGGGVPPIAAYHQMIHSSN